MDKKATDIVGYLGPIGLVLAYIFGSREESKFHLNQALVLCIVSVVLNVILSILGKIPLVGWLISLVVGIANIALFVLWIMGFAGAIGGKEKPVPILGAFQLLK